MCLKQKNITLKKVIFTLLIITGSTVSQPIGDFAPMIIGSAWTYVYKYHYSSTTDNTDESLKVDINILSKTVRLNDTIICLNISENGELYYHGIQYFNSNVKSVLSQH